MLLVILLLLLLLLFLLLHLLLFFLLLILLGRSFRLQRTQHKTVAAPFQAAENLVHDPGTDTHVAGTGTSTSTSTGTGTGLTHLLPDLRALY